MQAFNNALASSNSIGGYFNAGGRDFRGRIGEAALYAQLLNNAQRQTLNSYYEVKYAFTGGVTNDRYTGDSLHGYRQGVFGIGTTDGTAGNTYSNTGAAGFGIEAINSSLNAANEFVMAGHNSATNSYGPNGVMQRVWFVDSTGSVDGTLSFDFSDAGVTDNGASQFNLMFGATAGSLSVLSSAFTRSGDQVSFNVLGIQDGFYTLQALPAVPEPGTLALFGSVLALVGGWQWKRRRAS